jgi:hypothetical protein
MGDKLKMKVQLCIVTQFILAHLADYHQYLSMKCITRQSAVQDLLGTKAVAGTESSGEPRLGVEMAMLRNYSR